MDIPRISYNKLINNNKNELENLKVTMMEIGFFKLYDHDVSDEFRIAFQNITKQFFALPLAEKIKVSKRNVIC